MSVSGTGAPVLLDDEQVRGYIANGYVQLKLSVALRCTRRLPAN